MQRIEACVIGVAAVHDVDGAGLGHDQIERVDVTHFSVRDVDEGRDVAAQIEQRVHLHGGLCALEVRPREHRQAQVDRRGIECVNRLFEFHIERIVDIQYTSTTNQNLGEVGKDSPIVNLVGVGQGTARNLATNARVIQLRSHRSETRFDIAQTFAKRQLRKCQTQKLIATRKLSLTFVARVTTNTFVEFVPRQELHELSKHQDTLVHKSNSKTGKCVSRLNFDMAS